jgi:hypothetical protein
MSATDDVVQEQKLEDGVASAVRYLRLQVRELTAERDELQKLLGFYQSARTAPIAAPSWEVTPAKSGATGLVVAQITDTHWDEVVKPEEIFHLNAYSREIALLRWRRWVDKVVTLPRQYVNGVRLDGLVIPATGDLLSGDIHAELKESNEDHLLASLLFWAEQLISALETLEREYKSVAVHAVVGNHPRTTVKPVFKGRAHTNLEWLLWSIVRDRLADRGSKVYIEVSDSMDLNVPLYGRNHLLTHGDQFKGGTGISGSYSPLALGSHRKSKRQLVAGMPMETMVIGHLHQLINIPGVIMGGCAKGYDEYAFGLNLPPAEAAQAMWITTPERAQTIWMPVFLQDRVSEGW